MIWRRVLILVAGIAAVMLIVALAQFSRSTADGLMVLTPNGRFCVVGWFRGTCLIYARQLELVAGSGQPLMVQTFSVDAESYIYYDDRFDRNLNLAVVRF